MLITLFAAKGGQGTTTAAAAMACKGAEHQLVTLVDFGEDVLPALGIGPGVDGTVPIDASGNLAVLTAEWAGFDHEGWRSELLDKASRGLVIVDAGTNPTGKAAEILEVSDRRIVVTRPCYLALRRFMLSEWEATHCLLVNEPGRSLGPKDVEGIVECPVAVVPYDPSVSRAIDAGTMAWRLPRILIHNSALDASEETVDV